MKVIIYGIGKVKCSSCGNKSSTSKMAGSRFCPSCGEVVEAWNYESDEVKQKEKEFLRKGAVKDE